MQGSVAISHSPVIMENTVFRQKLGLSLTRSVLQRNSGNSSACGGAATARCLFGPPDVKQSKDLVREVELKNALVFGKCFNFDIVNGEPFPSAKKIKLSHESYDDSDQENANVHRSMDEEEIDNEGYIWTETYSEDYMAMCNKHAVNTSIVGPSRHAVVPLLFAPTVHSNHPLSSSLSPKSTAIIPLEESPKVSTSVSESSSSIVIPSPPASPLNEVSSSETNNNNISSTNKSQSTTLEKRHNRINTNHHLHHLSHHHQPSAKKSSLSTAHQILTKYTQRVVKHAVMKKPRKSAITDYLHVRRMKASSQQSGKKQ